MHIHYLVIRSYLAYTLNHANTSNVVIWSCLAVGEPEYVPVYMVALEMINNPLQEKSQHTSSQC